MGENSANQALHCTQTALNDERLAASEEKMVSRKKSKQRPKTWNHFSHAIYAVSTLYTLHRIFWGRFRSYGHSSACSVLCGGACVRSLGYWVCALRSYVYIESS